MIPRYLINVSTVDSVTLVALPASNFWIVGSETPVFSAISLCVIERLRRYCFNRCPIMEMISVFDNSLSIIQS